MTRMGVQGACAAEGDKAPKFESLDKDSNGKISLTEASEHDALFVAFKNLDKNKDGELTKEEFASYTASR
jgi:Ca2+-binding EF-hand superfamily protein